MRAHPYDDDTGDGCEKSPMAGVLDREGGGQGQMEWVGDARGRRQ